MVFSFLKNLFGSDAPVQEQKPSVTATVPEAATSLEGFVSYVVNSLVDNPAGVTVSTVDKDRTSTIQVACDKKDIGKIIGKNGKTIAAIRALTSGAAGRLGRRVNVEILD